jgi:pyruvate formate lyase activating enzyme
MRCAYCHNPDTWSVTAGTLMDPEEIIKQLEQNRSFYTNGGITVTGGEPLLKVDFLIDLFTLAKERDIQTCIDTSGITYRPGNTA